MTATQRSPSLLRRASAGLIAAFVLGGAAAAGTTARPPSHLCVLDENLLLSRSELAQGMASRFQQVRLQAQRAFDTESRTLDADTQAFNAQQSDLSPEVAREREAVLALRRSTLQDRGKQINRDLADLDSQLTKNVLRLSQAAIQSSAQQRGCYAVVLRTNLVEVTDPSIDITETVLAHMIAAKAAGPSQNRR